MITAPTTPATPKEKFLQAVTQGDLDTLKSMLNGKQGDVRLASCNNNQPLLLASQWGQVEIVNALLKFDQVKNLADALQIAFKHRQLEVFKTLVLSPKFEPWPNWIPTQDLYANIAIEIYQKKDKEDLGAYADILFNEGAQNVCLQQKCKFTNELARNVEFINSVHFVIFDPTDYKKVYTTPDQLKDAIHQGQFDYATLKKLYAKAHSKLARGEIHQKDQHEIQSALTKIKGVLNSKQAKKRTSEEPKANSFTPMHETRKQKEKQPAKTKTGTNTKTLGQLISRLTLSN